MLFCRSNLMLTLALAGLAGCSDSQAQDTAQGGFPAVTLNPSKGIEVGFAYEAFLSPHQEPGDESETPPGTPEAFQSTTASTDRVDRPSKGHGMVRFTKDLRYAQVDIAVEGIDPSTINMFHIHCGKPDQLGPIMLDLGIFLDLPEAFADGELNFTADFSHIVASLGHSHGGLEGFLSGCPIIQGINDDHKTISGMKYVAAQGELYFNLHTTGQTYYGDIRGRLHAIELSEIGQ
ncbi:MAG: CHRD domain-containing protein [Bradymonadia bacterium]